MKNFGKALKIFTQRPLLSVIILYFLSVIIINPFGEFVVNDDWIFTRQIEAFLTGRIRLSQLIDPSFIAQGVLGYGWVKIVGYSFTSLRILTILLTPLLLLGFSKLLDYFEVKSNLKLLILLLITFNPLIFTSSISFMTEIYFLLFFIWGVYFYVRSFSKKGNYYSNIILGSIFTGLSILVRHVGISLFIAYLLTLVIDGIKNKKPKKEVLIKALISTIPVILAFIVYFWWPRYSHVQEGLSENPALANIQKVLIQPKYLWERVSMMFYSLIYYAFFLSPVLIILPTKVKREYKPLLLAFVAVLAFRIYNLDLFPVGNVFFVEKLYGKSGFKTNFSLFDNVLFKMFMSFFIAAAISKFLVFVSELFDRAKTIINNKKQFAVYTFLFLTSLGMFGITVFGNDFYDRYLLPSIFIFLFVLLLSIPKLPKLNLKYGFYALVLISFMAFILQLDFIHRTKLQWEQGRELIKDTGRVKSIYINDLFSKFMNAEQKEDFTGLIGLLPGSSYVCFVQVYTTEETKLVKYLLSINNRLRRYQKNPKIYDSKTVYEPPKIKKKLSKLSYNEEYKSPIYNLVGKRSLVGAWCDLEKD